MSKQWSEANISTLVRYNGSLLRWQCTAFHVHVSCLVLISISTPSGVRKAALLEALLFRLILKVFSKGLNRHITYESANRKKENYQLRDLYYRKGILTSESRWNVILFQFSKNVKYFVRSLRSQ